MNANPQVGRAAADDVVAEARRCGDHELLSVSLRAVAWAERARLDIRSARSLLDEAVRAARRAGSAAAEGLALVSRAIVLQEAGRVSAAVRDLDTAALVAARRAEEDPETAGAIIDGVRFQRAVIAQNSGHLAEAVDQYTELLSRPGIDVSLAAKALNNVAMIQAQQGRYREAERSSQEALRRAEGLGPVVLAPFTVSRAWVAAQAGRLAESLRYFDRAALLYEEAGLSLAEHFAEYADAMVDLRLLPEAAAAAQKAVDGFETAGAPLLGAEAELRVARIALLSGRYDAARSAAVRAADTLHRQHRAGWRDRALTVIVESRLGLGEVGREDLDTARRAARRLEQRGDLPAAVEANLVAGRVGLLHGPTRSATGPLDRAAELAREGPVLLRIRGRLAAALAARALGDHARVLRECRVGIRDLASHRSGLPTMELRALASGHGAELGEIGLGAVIREGTPGQILRWMERTRAAALMAIAPEPTDQFQDLRDALREGAAGAGAEPRAAGSAIPPARTSPPEEDGGAVEHERRIRQAAWTAAGTRVRADWSGIPGTAQLRTLLDGRTLVEFGRLEGRIVALVVGPRRARCVDLVDESDVVEQLRALFFALRRLANPRGGRAAEAARASADLRVERLRELLVAPLEVADDAELVVVPVGSLHGVPWSALRDAPVAVAPSATFWARTRRAALERPFTRAGTDESRTVLVAGPELAGAEEEVHALREVHPDARLLGPGASTAHEAIEALRTAELGHLACHGSLRTDNPMFSALMLADGPVTVQELHSAGVAPHRLVLASCHSGADVAYAGDEVLGFVSAVLAQGTAGVVASIAAIPDVAAVDLMVELHRSIKAGRTLAHALFEARSRIDRELPEGYVNWCTFSAHGAA